MDESKKQYILNRKAFAMYREHIEAIRMMPEEVRLRLYDTIADYCLLGIEPSDMLLKVAFTCFRPALDKDIEAYVSTCQKNKENRSKRQSFTTGTTGTSGRKNTKKTPLVQAEQVVPLVRDNNSDNNKDINIEIKEREINKEKESPPPPVVSGLLMKAEDLRNDVYRLHGDWVEIFCMNNGIRMTDFRIWMDEFVKMLQNRNERKTMQDFQSHFASWFKIQFDHAKAKRAKTEVYDYAKQEMERQGEEMRKRHDEAKAEKITFEEYQELKKRAEAGDVEAKKIIGL